MRLETLNLEMTIDLWRIVSHVYDTNKILRDVHAFVYLHICVWARDGRGSYGREMSDLLKMLITAHPSVVVSVPRTFSMFFLLRLSEILRAWNCKFVAGLSKNNRISNFTCVCVREGKTESEPTASYSPSKSWKPPTTFKIANSAVETDDFPSSAYILSDSIHFN